MCSIYIQKQIDDLRVLNQSLDEIKDSIKKKESIIKTYMKQNSLEQFTGNNNEFVSYKPVVCSRFDTSRFKTEFSELYRSFSREITQYRFKISY